MLSKHQFGLKHLVTPSLSVERKMENKNPETQKIPEEETPSPIILVYSVLIHLQKLIKKIIEVEIWILIRKIVI